MLNINKLRVITYPGNGQKYTLICDYTNQSFTYKNEHNHEERFEKMTEIQLNDLTQILGRINDLRNKDYLGPITNDGMFWEFDLVNERNKMIEIEGINRIDEEVLGILSDLESLIKQPLGFSEFKERGKE